MHTKGKGGAAGAVERLKGEIALNRPFRGTAEAAFLAMVWTWQCLEAVGRTFFPRYGITGAQFRWMARYPGADGKFGASKPELAASDNPLGFDRSDPAIKDDIFLDGTEIAVPVNKPVIAHITSLDVIHSFKVVPIRMTQDATPGYSVPVHFIPTRTNTYQIQCSQLCGNGHYSMRGYFKVLSQEDFDAWIKSKPTVGAGAVSYE